MLSANIGNFRLFSKDVVLLKTFTVCCLYFDLEINLTFEFSELFNKLLFVLKKRLFMKANFLTVTLTFN